MLAPQESERKQGHRQHREYGQRKIQKGATGNTENTERRHRKTQMNTEAQVIDTRPGAISDRKAGIALNDLLAQQRPLARLPERCPVDDPVAKRTAVGTIAARDRAWNADELGPHFIAGETHRRIAVTAHIHEFKVRGKFRIGNGVSALQVETLGVFEARADAVLEEHVVSPFGLVVFHSRGPSPRDFHSWVPCAPNIELVGPVGQKQRTERMILGKTVLISLHRPRAGQRGADETDPDRLELGGWQ